MMIQTLKWRKPRRVDVFGTVHAKTLDNATAISPVYRPGKEFSLYNEDLDSEIGTVEVAPYDTVLGEQFIKMELNEQVLEAPESEIYRVMEDAEEAINKFYTNHFPSMGGSQASSLGLVEKAHRVLNENQQEQNPGIYQF